MKKLFFFSILTICLILTSCKSEISIAEENLPTCDQIFTMSYHEYIPVVSMDVPHSKTQGNLMNFINPCKPNDSNPIILSQSQIRTHQLVFVFDAIYPIDAIMWTSYDGDLAKDIPSLSVDVSINNQNFHRVFQDYTIHENHEPILLGGIMAKSVRITFKADEHSYGIQDVRFRLGEGFVVQEDLAWSQTFLRYEGWTGADGIFSFNLTDGKRSIGANAEHSAFIFSDTFVGSVFTHNKLRGQSRMINNSLGYFDHQKPFDQAFSFDYPIIDGVAQSPFIPDTYIGKRARNLLDGDGLSATRSKHAKLTNQNEGTMWLSDTVNASLYIDLYETQALDHMVIWNYNEVSSYGVKSFNLSYAVEQNQWVELGNYQIIQASGSNQESFHLELPMEVQARYLKIEVLEGYSTSFVGLGKIMIFNQEHEFVFGEIHATHEIITPTTKEQSARLWLQDGIVIDDKLYVFPILIKDELNFFKVHNVGLMEIPIVNNRLDYEQTIYFNSPLQIQTEDGGTIFFGAGVLNHTDIDGYVYIYGYKDLDGRHLVVARTTIETFLNFNTWTYYDGHSFQSNPTKSKELIKGVSPELSVTHLPSGLHKDKFMLISIENSISGRVVYSLAETPYGPFEPFTLVYQAMESTFLNGAFAYNAKMHPHLSEPGNYLISYNVNTTNLGALNDARIYYPRFIRLIEVKNDKE